MANTLMEQLNDPNIGLKNADERIVDMVSKEYLLRYANKIARELKKANLKYPNADFADLITSDDRTLDKNILYELMTCDFIEEKRNLVITGPCGSGKTWIACTIAVKALTQLKTVRFYSSSKLVLKLSGMTSEAYLKALDEIEQKFDHGEKLSQQELDLLGDYAYSSDVYDDGKAGKLVEYMLRRADKNEGLEISVPILGAMTNYCAKNFYGDEEINYSSKFYIVDRFGQDEEVDTASSAHFGCVFNQQVCKDIKIGSSESLDKPRTLDCMDPFWVMSVAFHELEHDHQRNEFDRGLDTPLARARAMNLLTRNQKTCIINKENGNNVGYYDANHDSEEIEIDADEASWYQLGLLIKKHQDKLRGEIEVLGVLSLNASGVTIRVIGRAEPLSQWEMERELRKDIKVALDEANIEIPYPKTTIINKE